MADNLTIEDALDYCLLNPDGLGEEELLGKFPEHNAELEPLLARAQSVMEVTTVAPPVSVERRAAMKERVMAAASLRSDSRQATHPVPAPVHLVRDKEPEQEHRKVLLWPRMAWASTAVAAVLVLSIWWGAASAMPDSPLYDVRLTSEQVAVNFASTVAERIRSHVSLCETRLSEIKTMALKDALDTIDKPLDSYRENLDNGADLLSSTSGTEQGELAKLVHTTASDGGQLFDTLQSNPKLPSNMRANLNSASTSASNVAFRVALLVPSVALPAPAPTASPASASVVTPPPAATRALFDTSVEPTAPAIGPSAVVLATVTQNGQAGAPGPLRTQMPATATRARLLTAVPTKAPVIASPTITGTRTLTPVLPLTRTPVPPTSTYTSVPGVTLTVEATATLTPEVQATYASVSPTDTAVPLTVTIVPPQPTDTPDREPRPTATARPSIGTATPEPPNGTDTPVPPIDTPRPTNTRPRPTNTRSPPSPVPTTAPEE